MTLVTIKADQPLITDKGFSISATITGSSQLPTKLVAHVESGSDRLDPPRSMNWALAALIMPAMKHGIDLHFTGAICPLLLHNAQNDLQWLLRTFEPGLNHIAISSQSTAKPLRIPNYRAATGFSGGIDSFATINLYRSGASEKSGLQINHLCVFIVGAFEGDKSDIELQHGNSIRRAEEVAKDLNADVTSIRTNFSEAYAGIYSFEKTHTLRNAAAAFLMEEAVDNYLYSSALPYKDIKAEPERSMGAIDPIILPLISSASLRFLSAGAGLTRLQKTMLVAKMPEAYPRLDVCVGTAAARKAVAFRNCSRCWKCDRTMLTLDFLGALDNFETVFDLDLYRRRKKSKIRQVCSRAIESGGNDMAIIAMIKEAGWRVPSPYEIALRKWLRIIAGPIRPGLKRISQRIYAGRR